MRSIKVVTIGVAVVIPIIAAVCEEPTVDKGKLVLERPVKQLVKSTKESDRTRVVTRSSDPPKSPAVAPGLVRWHSDFAAACRAAQSSGKPVLLFQLLGKLDEGLT